MNTKDSINPFKDDMTGRLLLGRYRILRRLATGGMGVVYLARSEGAAGFVKPVVVKLILPLFASNKEFSGMFAREARILANLQHPGIVSVIEFAEELDCYIMVLEYVHGYQLAEWKKFVRAQNRTIPTHVLIQIVINVLDALHYAHTVKDHNGELIRIIHRDISPANIMLDLDGHVKLVDFGIAFVSETTEGFKTTNRSFKGKLSYSAPELFSNQKATVQSDVYSCGITLHETLVGKNEFFFKDHASIVNAVLKHVPSSVHAVRDDAPAEIDEVIWRGVAKKPHQRYKSAAEFAEALRRISTVPEHKSLAALAELVKEDFQEDMAEFLGVESLRERGRAWRTPSLVPTLGPPPRETQSGESTHGAQTTAKADFSSTSETETEESANTALENRMALQGSGGEVKSVVVVDKSSIMPLVYLVVGVFVLGILGVGILVYLNRTDDTPEEKQFLLVQSHAPDNHQQDNTPKQKQGSANQNKAAEGPFGDPANQRTPEAVTKEMGNGPKQKSKVKPKKVKKDKPPGPDMVALTRAFRKKKGQIHRCFERFPQEVEEAPRLSVLFNVAADGTVNGVNLAPASLSSSPLGQCLLKVSKTTSFPAQNEALSFRIPLSAQIVKK